MPHYVFFIIFVGFSFVPQNLCGKGNSLDAENIFYTITKDFGPADRPVLVDKNTLQKILYPRNWIKQISPYVSEQDVDGFKSFLQQRDTLCIKYFQHIPNAEIKCSGFVSNAIGDHFEERVKYLKAGAGREDFDIYQHLKLGYWKGAYFFQSTPIYYFEDESKALVYVVRTFFNLGSHVTFYFLKRSEEDVWVIEHRLAYRFLPEQISQEPKLFFLLQEGFNKNNVEVFIDNNHVFSGRITTDARTGKAEELAYSLPTKGSFNIKVLLDEEEIEKVFEIEVKNGSYVGINYLNGKLILKQSASRFRHL